MTDNDFIKIFGMPEDIFQVKTASEIPFELTDDASNLQRSMEQSLDKAEQISKQIANNPQMLDELGKLLRNLHQRTKSDENSMSDRLRMLRGLSSGYGHRDALDTWHMLKSTEFLTEPEFEAQKIERGYPRTYTGSRWTDRYTNELPVHTAALHSLCSCPHDHSIQRAGKTLANLLDYRSTIPPEDSEWQEHNGDISSFLRYTCGLHLSAIESHARELSEQRHPEQNTSELLRHLESIHTLEQESLHNTPFRDWETHEIQ